MSKKVLGRGLGAFFPEYAEGSESTKTGNETTKTAIPIEPSERVNQVLNIPVNHIRPNPHQPRSDFNEKALQELASSIENHGLIQPVTVRYLGEHRFELISGERRLRASKLAGIDEIPAYVREADDEQIIAFALIENIQREQLNPLEVAIGYQRLMEECEYSQTQVADRIGKNRSTVANMLRLLQLPDYIQAALRDEKITTGHARALINIKDEANRKNILKKILDRELSVRQVEELVRSFEKKNKQKKKKTMERKPDPFLDEITGRLRQKFGTKVNIRQKGKGGEIRIEFYSDDELDRLLQIFDNL